MIKDDFYEADPNFSAVSAEVTLPFNDLALTDSTIDPVHAYYMGAITGNAAHLYTGKSVLLSGSSLTSDKFTISDAGESINWGIMHSPPRSSHENIIYYNGTQWYSTTTSYRLINKLNAFSCRVPGGLSLRFAVKQKRTVTLNGRTVVYCDYRMLLDSVDISMNAKQFTDFIENGTTITIQTGIAIKWEDAIDSRYWEVVYNDTTYLVTLISCTIANWYSYYTPDTNVYPKPFVGIKVGDDLIIQPDCDSGYQYNTTNRVWINGDWTNFKLESMFYNNYTHSVSSNYLPGSTNILFPAIGDIPLDIMDWDSRQGNYIPYVFNNDITCFVHYDTYRTIDGAYYYGYSLYAVLSPIDIYKAVFCAFWRDSANESTTANALYQTGDLVTIYDSANNPLKKEPFTTYTEIESKLRIWQKYGHDISEDDYDPDNPPSPIPPRPEPVAPGDDEHGGDDITLPSIDGLGGSFGFTTQYALRGLQLEELGAALWAGFDTSNPDVDDYIRNFVYNVDPNTGSVNMSDIMTFFISLRAYPLPLGNLTSISAAGTDLYIGAGTAPLRKTDGTTPFTSALHTANTYLSEVDAGSVTIPFWFGDYRDYSTEITLYLPYCGTAELNAADVMGGTLSATYVVDLSTGSCTAYVMCDTYDGHTYPVAILPGQLGVDIPITASNAGRVGARLLGDRINVAENLLSVAKYGATGIGALMSGNVAGAIRSGISAFIDPAIQDQKLLAGMAERGAIAAPMLSGGRGLAGFKNPMTAYVQVRSPFYAVPDNFADAVGDPAATYVQIGSCSGFCRFINVDVTGITTDAEDQAEIRRALENGVII